MNADNNNKYRFFSKNVLPPILILLALFAAFGAYVLTEKRIDRANELRLQTYLLADQLRQSSDDLTRMARTYAATGEPRYKKYHQAILDIRNGKLTRPAEYFYAYWDLVIAGQLPEPVATGPGVALLDLMRAAGFTDEELDKLSQAKHNSDRLAAMELQAMQLAEGEADGTGIRQMLYGADYHLSKAGVMQPLNTVYHLVEQRTLAGLRSAEFDALLVRCLFLAGALAAVFLLLRSYAAQQATLGGKAAEIRDQMRRIALGDLDGGISVPPGLENSVLGGLAEMRQMLQTHEADCLETERILRESESRLKTLFNTQAVGIVVINQRGGIEDMNQAGETLFGYALAEIKGSNVNVLMPEPYHSEHDAYIGNYLRSGEKKILGKGREVFGQRKDGATFPMVLMVGEAQQAGQRVFIGFVSDISERRQLQTSLDQYRAIVQSSHDAIISKDMQGIITSWNGGAETLFGYRAEEMIGQPMLKLFPADQVAEEEKILQAIARGERISHFESVRLRKDGSPVEISATLSPIVDADGNVIGMSNIIRDMTERKRAEAASRQYKVVIEAMRDGFWVVDQTGRIVEANQAYAGMSGYSIVELANMRINQLDTLEEPADIQARIAKILAHGHDQFETRHRRKDGSEFEVEVAVNYIAESQLFYAFFRDITERKRSENTLKSLQSRLQFLLESTPAVVYACRASGDFGATFVSDNVSKLLGYPPKAFIEDSGFWLNHIHPDDRPAVLDGLADVLDKGAHKHQYRFRHRDGGYRWMYDELVLIRDSHGQALELVGYWTDISERKQAEDALRIAAATFETHEAIMITDAQANILRVNHAFETITGFNAEEVIGRNPRVLSSGRHDKTFYQAMWRYLLNTGIWEGEIWDRRKSGQIYPKWLTITALKDARGKPTEYVAIFTDITERKQAEEEIRHLAFYDPLTKLPNRRLLLDRLHLALAASERSNQYGSLLFLDMDKFKSLNDMLGHNVGDRMLVEVAERIKYNVREVDTVARFGGDEFVVLFEDLGIELNEASQRVALIAEKIRAALAVPFHFEQHVHNSSPSIGVCMYRGQEQSSDELIKHADIAMYQAKNAGRNRVQFFDPALQQSVETRAALESDLRLALLKHEFRLYYQVQCDARHKALGAEALIRWLHPKRGMVPPMQFIPIAEESVLILEIGQWVLDSACRQLAAWEKNPATRDLQLAINVSAHQFMLSNFVDSVQAAVRAHGIEPSRLKLELTESVIANDIEEIVGKMQLLKQFGVRLSLDDFGTGYSSLSYLKRLPIDQIKIDQSFVRDIATDPNDAVMVKNIIDIANNFKLNVIAEGVESEDQLEFLRRNGCMAYQGYLFGKPMPIGEFERMLEINGVRVD